eukprot:CAMPEP_0175302026 /NCGR_PEP_ID=MMETSP0093-20121207/61963_1 /TAXON_ID=311494 /ORGANISM="Alexandrium monilatum, Strain CCMP3105" /LENGTH=76 /DNA_ID=CAMNT_0016598303 /DNA_START=136 /DNA_END=366 /DNA_ORIENTATION=-
MGSNVVTKPRSWVRAVRAPARGAVNAGAKDETAISATSARARGSTTEAERAMGGYAGENLARCCATAVRWLELERP